MSEDSEDIDGSCLPPPPPEFADELPPSGSTFRSSVSSSGESGFAEDNKFFDDYYCNLTRENAIEVLEAVQMEGAFIVRPGSGSPYCISFLHGGETKHVKIQRNNRGQYYLGDTKIELYFDSMSLLMEYLTKNVIQGVNGLVFRLIINAKPYSQSLKSGRTPPTTDTFSRNPYQPHHTFKTSARSPSPPPPPPLPARQPSVPEFCDTPGSIMPPRRNSTFGCGGGVAAGGGADFTLGSSFPCRTAPRGSFSASQSPPPHHQRQQQQQQHQKRPEAPRIRPLVEQRYYVDLRRDEAEAHLMNTRIEGQFLVRPSKASAYCLSLFHRGRVVHLKIVCMANRFVLEQLLNDGQTFANVPDLIDSLCHRTLTLMNGDTLSLRPID